MTERETKNEHSENTRSNHCMEINAQRTVSEVALQCNDIIHKERKEELYHVQMDLEDHVGGLGAHEALFVN